MTDTKPNDSVLRIVGLIAKLSPEEMIQLYAEIVKLHEVARADEDRDRLEMLQSPDELTLAPAGDSGRPEETEAQKQRRLKNEKLQQELKVEWDRKFGGTRFSGETDE